MMNNEEWHRASGVIFDAICPSCNGLMARGNKFCCLKCYEVANNDIKNT